MATIFYNSFVFQRNAVDKVNSAGERRCCTILKNEGRERIMRIAVFHASLPHTDGHRPKEGGVSYFVHRLANQLVRAGHNVVVFSLDTAPEGANYRVVRLPLPKFFLNRFLRSFILPFYLNLVNFRGFDVLHIHGDDHFFWARRVPTVRTFHGSALAEAISAVTLKRKIFQRILYPLEVLSSMLADVSVGVSQSTKKYLLFMDTVIPNGVDLTSFRYNLHIHKSINPSILFVGELKGRKRGQLLLDLFEKRVLRAFPNAELWMVSDKGGKTKNVRWFDVLSEQELVALYQKAWIFCMPSTYEGFGIPYIESMACGTPIVATPNEGATEVLDGGKYGFFVADQNLCTKIIELLENKKLREDMTRRALRYVKKFGWDIVISQYEAAYRRAIENRSGARRHTYGLACVERLFLHIMQHLFTKKL